MCSLRLSLSIYSKVSHIGANWALNCRRIEGSHATARQTAELLRFVVSQHRMPHTNQTASLLEAVRAVGEQLIAANPVGEL